MPLHFLSQYFLKLYTSKNISFFYDELYTFVTRVIRAQYKLVDTQQYLGIDISVCRTTHENE